MSSPDKKKKSLKEKIFHEMVEYWVTFCYLTLVFAAFTQYRRFVLAAHDITYTNYGIAVIEALILAKVVLIGDALRLGRNLDQRPLIYSTLFRTVVFTLFVALFSIIEHAIKGLWHGKGVAGGIDDFFGKGPHELLANSLVVFVSFIPFFAFKELGRVLGVEKIRALFFRRRDDQGSEQKENKA
jgi:hypothetical protein